MTLSSYLAQFVGDDDPMATCRQRNKHNWYTASSIFGRFAECRDCHTRIQEPHEHAPDRINWLEYHMDRLNGELRGRSNHEDYIAICRAQEKHEWYKLWGGLQCRQCGVQIPLPEPFTVEAMEVAMKRSADLDAELRASK